MKLRDSKQKIPAAMSSLKMNMNEQKYVYRNNLCYSYYKKSYCKSVLLYDTNNLNC